MARPTTKHLTDGEIEIIRFFWESPDTAFTVKEIHRRIRQNRTVALTTVASMMQLMAKKDLLYLQSDARPFRYVPAITLDVARQRMLGHVAEMMFDNDMGALAAYVKKPRRP